ncbi:MAG: hypothetical protein L3J33_00565 [Rhodobacteraceae bacterium]|nr:hypothetical protein [Paracoccaceae bacterium]
MPKSGRTLLVDGYQAKPKLRAITKIGANSRGYQGLKKPSSLSSAGNTAKLPKTTSAVQKPAKK